MAPGGPAEKAGIKAGDVISPQRQAGSAWQPVGGYRVHHGSRRLLNITVMREGKKDDYKVVVGDLAQIFPDRFGRTAEGRSQDEEGAQSSSASGREPDQPMRQNLGLKEKAASVVRRSNPAPSPRTSSCSARRTRGHQSPARRHNRRSETVAG